MKLFPPINEQMDIIRRGVVEIIPEEDLVQKLEKSIKTGHPLRIKFGCDPSKPDLHLGHSVVLWKLREFQDLGHMAVLIIGDFTGMIGDPSGRNKTRPPLSLDETKRNGMTYFEQATKILRAKRVEMIYNSEWLAKMSFEEVIKLASKYTVARMLERDDFEKRYKTEEPIGVHEFLYPLAQAMDSVAIRADVELGGSDQKFNLLVGRDIQREYNQNPQVILTMPILPGTDGKEKMSKTFNNYIAFMDTPQDIYGKTMSIPDTLIYDYFLLTVNKTLTELEEIKRALKDPKVNPRDLKRELAKELVCIYYDQETAIIAEKEFDQIFIQKKAPDEMTEFKISPSDFINITLVQLLVLSGCAPSNSEARRLIQQGGISINGKKIEDMGAKPPFQQEFILKAGKRKFIKVIVSP
jgi:tyrosyl-tRNA synthetase